MVIPPQSECEQRHLRKWENDRRCNKFWATGSSIYPRKRLTQSWRNLTLPINLSRSYRKQNAFSYEPHNPWRWPTQHNNQSIPTTKIHHPVTNTLIYWHIPNQKTVITQTVSSSMLHCHQCNAQSSLQSAASYPSTQLGIKPEEPPSCVQDPKSWLKATLLRHSYIATLPTHIV